MNYVLFWKLYLFIWDINEWRFRNIGGIIIIHFSSQNIDVIFHISDQDFKGTNERQERPSLSGGSFKLCPLTCAFLTCIVCSPSVLVARLVGSLSSSSCAKYSRWRCARSLSALFRINQFQGNLGNAPMSLLSKQFSFSFN